MRATTYLLAGWLFVPMLGCANLHDVRYEFSQKSRTRSAWRTLPDCAKDHQYPADYERGWKDGFYDVTTGGNGCPPVVAPSIYWKPSQILDHCDNRRHAYYSGFQDGAAHASSFPDTHHLKPWGSCDCPLPTCQTCPSTGCGCPIGSCGLSSTTDPTEVLESTAMIPPVTTPQPEALESAAMVPPVVPPQLEVLEMLETPASAPVASTPETTKEAAEPASPSIAQSLPPVPAPSVPSTLADLPKPVINTANVIGSATVAPAPGFSERESTVKQATPFILEAARASLSAQKPRAQGYAEAAAYVPAPSATPRVPAAPTQGGFEQESTVKQAQPFALEQPKSTGTVRLASQIELPN